MFHLLLMVLSMNRIELWLNGLKKSAKKRINFIAGTNITISVNEEDVTIDSSGGSGGGITQDNVRRIIRR